MKRQKTYGDHPGRERAHLPSRVEFRDAEGRVGCGIAGSTSLCRKMEKEVKGWAKRDWLPRRDSNPDLRSCILKSASKSFQIPPNYIRVASEGPDSVRVPCSVGGYHTRLSLSRPGFDSPQGKHAPRAMSFYGQVFFFGRAFFSFLCTANRGGGVSRRRERKGSKGGTTETSRTFGFMMGELDAER